jgi:hypothetical protein
VSDEAAELARQSAWVDQLRSQGRLARTLGFITCFAGVAFLVFARYRLGAPAWALWTGGLVVAVGWGLFVYALLRRYFWVRAHPFQSNG